MCWLYVVIIGSRPEILLHLHDRAHRVVDPPVQHVGRRLVRRSELLDQGESRASSGRERDPACPRWKAMRVRSAVFTVDLLWSWGMFVKHADLRHPVPDHVLVGPGGDNDPTRSAGTFIMVGERSCAAPSDVPPPDRPRRAATWESTRASIGLQPSRSSQSARSSPASTSWRTARLPASSALRAASERVTCSAKSHSAKAYGVVASTRCMPSRSA